MNFLLTVSNYCQLLQTSPLTNYCIDLLANKIHWNKHQRLQCYINRILSKSKNPGGLVLMQIVVNNTHYISIYIFYILFTSRQVEEFKNYQNTSSTSKVTSKTILIILLYLFSICNTFEFKVTQIFR